MRPLVGRCQRTGRRGGFGHALALAKGFEAISVSTED
jgi:hypothetical protein